MGQVTLSVIMLESVKIGNMWRLRFYGGRARYYHHLDRDEPMEFPTKKEAEAARRKIERGNTGWPTDRKEHFRGVH